MAERWRDVAHIGHAELLTPAPEASLEYLTTLLGLTVVADGGGSWYLRGHGDYEPYCLKLTASDHSGLGHLAVRAWSPEALTRRVEWLKAAGVPGGWTEPAGALSGAGISARVAPNALELIWAKVAFNCVMNTLCSIASIPVSALARYDGFDPLASSILDEIAAVARAEGVTVDTAAALTTMKAQFDPSASGSHLASMLQDLMNSRRTEISHLNGAVAARAARHGIAAPANTLIARLVGLLEATWPDRVSALHAV